MGRKASDLTAAPWLLAITKRMTGWVGYAMDALRRPPASDRAGSWRATGWPHLLLAAILAAALGIPLYIWELRYLDWSGVDWWLAYYPAGNLLVHGSNPYQIPNFHNPAWALLPLLPFVLMGKTAGGIAVFFVNLFSFAFIAFRLGAKLPAVLMLVLSPFMFYALYFDNIDWLVLWGFILPPPIGLLFVMLKPQVGIAVALYWVYAAWRDGGWRRLVVLFAPLAGALAANFVIFGGWLRPTSDQLTYGPYNQSVFPWSVPIGLLLLYLSIRYRRRNISISASPFLSPYLNMGSWTMVFVGFVDNTWLMTAAFVAGWILFLTQGIVPLLR